MTTSTATDTVCGHNFLATTTIYSMMLNDLAADDHNLRPHELLPRLTTKTMDYSETTSQTDHDDEYDETAG